MRPGQLSKRMKDRIKARRVQLGIPDPPELKMLTKKKLKTNVDYESSESEDEVEQKPTLTLKKDKEGTYTVNLHPLKDPKTLAPREDPYMNCTPMQFVFKLKKPETLKTLMNISEGSGEGNSDLLPACLCHMDENVVESSSESELDIQFTPPAGLIYPELFAKKPNVCHVDNQYDTKDLSDPDLPVILLKQKSKKKHVKI